MLLALVLPLTSPAKFRPSHDLIEILAVFKNVGDLLISQIEFYTLPNQSILHGVLSLLKNLQIVNHRSDMLSLSLNVFGCQFMSALDIF